MSGQVEAIHDPVCGMVVDPAGPHRHEHEGASFHFCCERCLLRFQEDPESFLGDRATQAPPAPGSRFTCPMHPEVVQDGPGSCPICGMALEPMEPTAEDENPELAEMTRRFWVSLALTLPVFALAMGEMIPGNPLTSRVSGQALAWAQLVLATPVVLWGGWPFIERGWASIRTRHLNMFTLIAIGTGAAWIRRRPNADIARTACRSRSPRRQPWPKPRHAPGSLFVYSRRPPRSAGPA